jgi:transcriptional regulator with XRE-family HTH domain
MEPNTVVVHNWINSDAEQDSYLVRLGRGITAMRERRQLSRKALASRLGVRTGVVGSWERGEHLPPGDKVIELMLVLEATPAELLSAGGKTSTRLRAMEARGPL